MDAARVLCTMTPQQLRERAKKFAVGIVRLCRSLPSDWVVREIGKQLVRSGTAVAANYRACQRGRSDKEFCAKMGVVVEEADETELWLELLPEADPGLATAAYNGLLGEARELVAIFSASHRTAKMNLEKKKAAKRKERASNRRTP
jgi:four helix bundle protein